MNYDVNVFEIAFYLGNERTRIGNLPVAFFHSGLKRAGSIPSLFMGELR